MRFRAPRRLRRSGRLCLRARAAQLALRQSDLLRSVVLKRPTRCREGVGLAQGYVWGVVLTAKKRLEAEGSSAACPHQGILAMAWVVLCKKP